MKQFFRKMFGVLGTGILLGSTLSFAGAAIFPQPFVTGSNSNVAIVVGSDADDSDMDAANMIRNNLLERIGNRTGGGGTVFGDSFAIEQSSDRLNLGESLTMVHPARIDEGDLEILEDLRYETNGNDDSEYEQFITLGSNLVLKWFEDDTTDNDEGVIGIELGSGTFILNYTVDFRDDVPSEIDSDRLVDLEDTDIELLGREYRILTARNDPLRLELVGGAVEDIINVDESKTYTVGGEDVDVSLTFLNNEEAVFEVDGRDTPRLEEGDTYTLTGGQELVLTDIFFQDFQGGIQRAEFTLGGGLMLLEHGQELEIGDDTVEGVRVFFESTETNDELDLRAITFNWAADEDMSITPESSITMPGLESIRLAMDDFVTPAEEEMMIESEGGDTLKMTVEVEDGTYNDLAILSSDADGFSVIGEDEDSRLITSSGTSINFDTDTDNKFIASWSDGDDAESYILDVTNVAERDGDTEVTIRNLVSNENSNVDIGDTVRFGRVELTLANANDNQNSANFTINSGGSFNKLYTKEGLAVYLPVSTSGNSSIVGGINLGGNPTSYNLQFREEDEDENLEQGASFNVTYTVNTDDDITVSGIGSIRGPLSGDGLIESNTDDVFVGYINSSLATRIQLDTSGDNNDVTITYHGAESYAVALIGVVGEDIDGNETDDEDNRIMIVEDDEVDDLNATNIIVVGGSCVNQLAAELLGVDYRTCSEDFTDETNVEAGEFLIETFSRTQGRIATLVAGYNAEDTMNAARFMTRTGGNLDITTGRRYTGNSATNATLATNGAGSNSSV